MSDILILGPQFRAPNLREALAAAGASGPVVAVTAGWQEREGELAALEEHLGDSVPDLHLYQRAEALFARDVELHEAHRGRQELLRRMQELYRVRLAHAKSAVRELFAEDDRSAPMRTARGAAIASLRRLDAAHLRDIDRVHSRFASSWGATRRPMLAREIEDLARALAPAQVVCIAGGHIAVLLNRLRLFELPRLLGGRTVIAWSAGAMALAERIVLFHDHPPQGAGDAEVFETGLGLVRGTVFLPHAAARLALDNRARVALFARRFSPAACLALDDSSLLHWQHGRLVAAANAGRLTRSGGTTAVVPA